MRSSVIIALLAAWVIKVSSFSVSRHSSTRTDQGSLFHQPHKDTRRKRVTLLLRGGAATATLDAFWREQPFVAAAVVCATKACAADVVAQQRQRRLEATDETQTAFDIRRNLSFLLYGALYQGVIQEFIYNNLYTRLFGNATTLRVITSKVLFDAVFHNALVCVPMVYLVRAFVFRYSFRKALRMYADDVMHHGLLFKYYAIWMPVNFTIYAVVPKHWRITTMAFISFFWMIILSTISSRKR